MCMTLKRRLVILMAEEDGDLLDRIAEEKRMGTSTLARSFVLEGMTRWAEQARAQRKRSKS